MPSLYRAFLLANESAVNACCVFIRANWQTFAEKEKSLTVEIRERGTKRTLVQNSHLHGLLRDIAEQAWINGRQYDQETWKEHFRRRFIGTEEIILPSGERIDRGISTTTLNVEDFDKFLLRIEVEAAEELGVILQ